MTRDVYIAIMVAAAKGNGLRLTADEAFNLSIDDAVATRAHNGLTKSDWPEHSDLMSKPLNWARVDPNKDRVGENLAGRAPEDMTKSRCPTCHRSDAEYHAAEVFCSDPWHGDDHLRRSHKKLGGTDV